jgi:hypothetical protein
MARIKPAVVGMAERFEFADVDHEPDLGMPDQPSSVTHVTAKIGLAHP